MFVFHTHARALAHIHSALFQFSSWQRRRATVRLAVLWHQSEASVECRMLWGLCFRCNKPNSGPPNCRLGSLIWASLLSRLDVVRTIVNIGEATDVFLLVYMFRTGPSLHSITSFWEWKSREHYFLIVKKLRSSCDKFAYALSLSLSVSVCLSVC